MAVEVLLSAAVAGSGYRAGVLSARGAVAATAVGSCAMAGGAAPGALLVAWFVWTTGWSRAGRARKAARTGGVVAKGGPRDPWQVVANGGVYALGVLMAVAAPAAGLPALAPVALVAAAGALAAAGADTLATEVGTWWGGGPLVAADGDARPPGDLRGGDRGGDAGVGGQCGGGGGAGSGAGGDPLGRLGGGDGGRDRRRGGRHGAGGVGATAAVVPHLPHGH